MAGLIDDDYLGDGVYASCEDRSIVLDLRAQDDTTRIVLEPMVLAQLDRYRERLRLAIAKAMGTKHG